MEIQTSLSKRIANVLIERKVSKRKAQMEEEKAYTPKVDPKVKVLDQIYECINDEETSQCLEHLYKLTNLLHLGDEVSFDLPEEHLKEHEENYEDQGDHDMPHVKNEKEEESPEDRQEGDEVES